MRQKSLQKTENPVFRTAYDRPEKYYIEDEEVKMTDYGKLVISENKEPSMTKESLAKDLDVNNIVRRHAKTGVLPNAHAFEGIYGEFDSIDLREAEEKVMKANELFMEVPSAIRAEFNNDAGAFIDYATDPANLEQMRQWKLAPLPEPDPEPEPPIEVTVVNKPSE
jgi:hypothetical protein